MLWALLPVRVVLWVFLGVLGLALLVGLGATAIGIALAISDAVS